MKDIKLEQDPWHLKRDGRGYVTVDGRYQARRSGMGWMIWKNLEASHVEKEHWRSVKPLSNLNKVRRWIQSQYSDAPEL